MEELTEKEQGYYIEIRLPNIEIKVQGQEIDAVFLERLLNLVYEELNPKPSIKRSKGIYEVHGKTKSRVEALLNEGKTVKEICEHLGKSENTVKYHIENIRVAKNVAKNVGDVTTMQNIENSAGETGKSSDVNPDIVSKILSHVRMKSSYSVAQVSKELGIDEDTIRKTLENAGFKFKNKP
jgi:DNA-binding CsgD family transcriptional regulator